MSTAGYRKTGDTVQFTAPSGGVLAGRVYHIGTLPVVALEDKAQGLPFQGKPTGEFDLTKVGSQAWTEGARIMWDAANNRCTTATTTGLIPIGVATVAVGSGAGETVGRVRLNGIGVAAL